MFMSDCEFDASLLRPHRIVTTSSTPSVRLAKCGDGLFKRSDSMICGVMGVSRET